MPQAWGEPSWKILLRTPLGRRRASARAAAGFGLELIFDDFPVERAAADIEDPRRFLLVPLRGFQHADDVRALGLGKGRELVAHRLRGGRRRVEEFDVR